MSDISGIPPRRSRGASANKAEITGQKPAVTARKRTKTISSPAENVTRISSKTAGRSTVKNASPQANTPAPETTRQQSSRTITEDIVPPLIRSLGLSKEKVSVLTRKLNTAANAKADRKIISSKNFAGPPPAGRLESDSMRNVQTSAKKQLTRDEEIDATLLEAARRILDSDQDSPPPPQATKPTVHHGTAPVDRPNDAPPAPPRDMAPPDRPKDAPSAPPRDMAPPDGPSKPSPSVDEPVPEAVPNHEFTPQLFDRSPNYHTYPDKQKRRIPRNPQHGRRHINRMKSYENEMETTVSDELGTSTPPSQTTQRLGKPRGSGPRGLWGRLRFDRRAETSATTASGESSDNLRQDRPSTAARQEWTTDNRFGKRNKMPYIQERDSEEEKPERLHKLLAEAGVGSRREMEEWIIAGRVSVNSLPAHVGQLIQPGDRVRVNGKLIDLKKASARQPRVLLYHKPEGQIVSRDDPQHRETVFSALPKLRSGRWLAVGRLDYNTSGLLLFTTSGDLANKLLHPSSNMIREYAVRIFGDISDDAKHALLDGIELEDGPARFSTLEEAGGEGANRWLNVTLYEGRNREVRRMFEHVGVTVSRLMRVRYGPFILPPYLKRGQVRELEPSEVESLMQQFGLTQRSWNDRGQSEKHERYNLPRTSGSIRDGHKDNERPPRRGTTSFPGRRLRFGGKR